MDRRPRMRKLPTGATAFIHPCEVEGCPEQHAPFGYGVDFRHGKPGRWRCKAHQLKTDALGQVVE
jgi:hypothetical protein